MRTSGSEARCRLGSIVGVPVALPGTISSDEMRARHAPMSALIMNSWAHYRRNTLYAPLSICDGIKTNRKLKIRTGSRNSATAAPATRRVRDRASSRTRDGWDRPGCRERSRDRRPIGCPRSAPIWGLSQTLPASTKTCVEKSHHTLRMYSALKSIRAAARWDRPRS